MEVSQKPPGYLGTGALFLGVFAGFSTLGGVLLIYHDLERMGASGPKWMHSMTIAQFFATILISVGATSQGLLSLATRRDSPRFPWRLTLAGGLFFLNFAVLAKDVSFTLLLLLNTIPGLFFGFHRWLVGKGLISFRPAPGSALYGTTFYGPPLTSDVGLRSQYEEKIRQAGAQEERNRLARDLHDSIKQQIFAIHTSAATAQIRLQGDGDGAREAIDQIRTAARDAMTEMEVMLDQLRAVPLEAAGLAEALKQLCETTGLRIDAPVECNIRKLPPFETLATNAAQATLRVAQEALANVARHARASRVKVTLEEWGTWMILTVEDDGLGLQESQESKGMGIQNMRSRAIELGGQLEILSTPGKPGTIIKLSVPASLPANSRPPGFWWLIPLTIMLGLSIARRWTDWGQRPEIAGALLWVSEACIAGMVIMFWVWLWKIKQNQKSRNTLREGTPA